MPELPLGAVVAVDFGKWDLREEICLLQHAGARLVQVYRNLDTGTPGDAIRQTLTAAGLVPQSLHAYIELEILDGPPFDLSARDKAAREAALALAEGEIAFAHALGVRDLVVHPVGPGDTAGDAWRPDALAASLERLAALAEAADVRWLVENMPPPMFGADAALLRRLVDAVGSDHVGLAFDSGHAMITGDPVGVVRAMGPRLWGVHLHDNDGTDDAHFLPGMGVIPFDDVARALAEVGYAGPFMLEIYRDTAEVWRDLTAERLAAIDRLRRLASGLDV